MNVRAVLLRRFQLPIPIIDISSPVPGINEMRPGLFQQQARLLFAADIAVVPSVRDDAGNVDGLPNVLLESLASGTPVVTTSAGGIGSVVVDGQTARLVPERDAAALAATVEQLLDQPEVAAKLGEAARAEMCRSHAWGHVAERFVETYDIAVHRAGTS